MPKNTGKTRGQGPPASKSPQPSAQTCNPWSMLGPLCPIPPGARFSASWPTRSSRTVAAKVTTSNAPTGARIEPAVSTRRRPSSRAMHGHRAAVDENAPSTPMDAIATPRTLQDATEAAGATPGPFPPSTAYAGLPAGRGALLRVRARWKNCRRPVAAGAGQGHPVEAGAARAGSVRSEPASWTWASWTWRRGPGRRAARSRRRGP